MYVYIADNIRILIVVVKGFSGCSENCTKREADFQKLWKNKNYRLEIEYNSDRYQKTNSHAFANACRLISRHPIIIP